MERGLPDYRGASERRPTTNTGESGGGRPNGRWKGTQSGPFGSWTWRAGVGEGGVAVSLEAMEGECGGGGGGEGDAASGADTQARGKILQLAFWGRG